jgi:hypothetical protein
MRDVPAWTFALALLTQAFCGPGKMERLHPSSSPTPTATVAPTSTAGTCPSPWPGEDGLWVGVDAPRLEQTKDAVRAAQAVLRDGCGRDYVSVNHDLARIITEAGSCAGVMGEAQDKVFVRIDAEGEQRGLYEQWHLAYSKNGCLITGPQQGLWARR